MNMNLVELFSPGVKDQPCAHGSRVEHYSVYCHSENPDAPRKCKYRFGSKEGHLKYPYFKEP